MNKVWNFLASNETRLCMHSLSSEISRILLTIVVTINLVEWIKSEHGACFLLLQVSSTQSQWTRLRALFHLMERDLVCFHYHRKCQYITDNCGDIKRSRVEQDRTRCILPTTSSVINSMSMNKIWNFLASNETRLCMLSLSPQMSEIY